MAEATHPAPPALRAEGVDVFLGKHHVLRGVSFEARQGVVTALVGPNGAGKSTLLRAAAGLLPHGGDLDLLGKPVHRYTAAERAQTVAYVPQRSALSAALRVQSVIEQGRFAHLKWTEQLGVGRNQGTHKDAVAKAMHDTDVSYLAQRRFTELSMGERRRVLLARGIATGARVLLLDEPTSALDVRHTLELDVLLKRLAKEGYAIVIVLHNLAEVRSMAEHAVLLRGGRVGQTGPVGSVIAKVPVRSAYGVELLEGGGLGYRLPDEEQSAAG